ncbi:MULTISPECIES: COX15/CtaA family protein [unclassified Cytobacillus]|uniref:COX15/CtaA family protein n=1 Tax=unclassified Cytobacillus TaxID=2675268 RepID=UPI00135CCBB0|nr:heme A synthase [Cytobacillus sp. AMY 15.2]KAF0820214.1 Heme A synthase, cytochrome oxidase biogenesis protein Cox15-CtaA [Bacillus sp. ZZV12-4809]MCM3089445.1 heme A synthase [Cytobacillus sp. AMY 15.2]
MQRSLKWFAVLTSFGMLLVLLGGALVTKTESGMGCGKSWPLCNGELVPTDITPELIIELAHRLVSGSIGFMVLILSIWTWRKIGHIRETKFLSLTSLFFLILQALIGAAAVVWGQSDFVLALHFGISLISFAAVLLLTLLIFEVDKKFEAEKLIIDKRMRKHIIGVSLYSYAVVYTGALVRHVNASLVCRDWPLCINDSFALPANMYEWVQMGHRAAAGLIFIWIAYITYLAVKHYREQKVIYWGWIISFILVSLQVAAGALVVLTRLNLYIALAHAFFISCLFGVLSYFILLTSRSRKNELAVSGVKEKEKNEESGIPTVTSIP